MGILKDVLDLRFAQEFIKPYTQRTKADSGILKREDTTKRFYDFVKANQTKDNIKFAWFGESATKIRTSGVNSYATKAYSMVTPQAKYGNELVVNGRFDNGTTGWAADGNALISNIAGVLRVTQNTGVIAGTGYQIITVEVGKRYLVKVGNVYNDNTIVQVGQFATGGQYFQRVSGTTPVFVYVIPTTTNLVISLRPSTTTIGQYSDFDNVSCVEVLNSLDGSPTDASQTTDLNQPNLSGNIAPNEKLCLSNTNGQSKYLTHPTISFGSNEAWSVTTVLNWNGSNALTENYVGGTNSCIRLRDITNNIYFVNANSSTTPLVGLVSSSTHIGKNVIITFTADGLGNLSVYINDKLKITVVSNGGTSIDFSSILRGRGNANSSAKIYAHIIRSGALTPTQVANEANFFRAIYPEIETVTIGSQQWATSNCDMVCTPQGNLVQEMQANANVEKIVNGGFDSGASWSMGTGWTISGGTANSSNGAGTYNTIAYATPSVLTVGRYYKVTFILLNYVSGALMFRVGGASTYTTLFNASGTYTFYIQAVTNTDLYALTQNGFVGSIDNVSVQEIGWSGSQELYDGIYAQTSGTVEQKTYAAVKAASMWSHYNNDPTLGSIYGKLYNWFAVKLLQMDIDYYNTANPTTPWNYKVPADTDFTTLQTTLGGGAVAGGKMKVAGTVYFNSPNTGADNSSGFTALGSGFRLTTGVCTNSNIATYYWSIDSAKGATLLNTDSTFQRGSGYDLRFGFVLRLLKS